MVILRCLYGDLGVSLLLLSLRYAEYDAEVAVGIAGAADAEDAHLASVFYMCAETRAHVVVAYIDEAQRVAGIGRELAEVDACGHLIARNIA